MNYRETEWVQWTSPKLKGEKTDCGEAILEEQLLSFTLTIEQDIHWLKGLAGEYDNAYEVFTLCKNNEIIGYAPLFIHPSSLQFCIGEISFFSYPITRYVLSRQPNIKGSFVLKTDTKYYEEFIVDLWESLPQRGLVFLSEVPLQSEFFSFISGNEQTKEKFHIVPHGPIYTRRLIKLGGTFEDYLKRLGSKTRQDLRRTRKGFIKTVGKEWEITCFTEEKEISKLLADVEVVAKKTYQWNLLGVKLSRGGNFEKKLRVAAKYGWLQTYVLYVRGVPIAFQIGYAYRGTYYAYDIGYDPSWTKLHVGIFLHTEIMIHLSEKTQGLKTFDFMAGDSLHKERLSTEGSQERHFYLMPKGKGIGFLVLAFRATNVISELIGKILINFNMKSKIKKLFRSLSVRTT